MKASDVLSSEELKFFTERSDARGAWIVLFNWGFIAAIFAVVALWTNPLTILLAIPLLGGRQMGLAVLMHEAGHKSLFRSVHLNEWVGQWLCAYPILGDCDAYGASHREHHRTAGTDADPDLPNYQDYPVSRASFLRKIKRDLTGQTGVKLLAGLFTARGRSIMMREGEKSNAPRQGLLVNLLLFAVLLLAGVGELYLLWLVAYLTAYPLIARIRQVAEHANVPDLFDLDPRLNTRTTIPKWYERLVFCPNGVNYHVEHHLLASVPCHKLKALHQILVRKGFYRGFEHTIASSYRDVIRRAVPEFDKGQAAAA
ncbi:MAG: fatty acid desaturase [Haliea sp.]|jgi:fatty acid desaturase|nr:fatty acid desaturase [Haliea sp.]